MNALNKLGMVALLLAAQPLHAITYTVNDAGSGPDSNLSDNTCSTATPFNNSTCTLHAAIAEANGKANAHIIKFAPGVTKITLAANLPQVTSPVTLDGTNPGNALSGGRVELDGAGGGGSGGFSCFSLSDVLTGVQPKGATGSTIKNFVIRRCNGNGVTLTGHGYTVTGNRIGTNAAASSGSGLSDANSLAGISLSGTLPPPNSVPTLSSLLATLPQGIAGVAALQASLQAALTVLVNPNTIAGNVVSGNYGIGIDIFGQGTVNTIVAGNIVGLSQDALSAVPNGRGPGGSTNRAGIRLSGLAYGNFIGPGNIVSGNLGDGIAIDSGAVVLPNFVAGNLVGLGSAPTDVGNAINGISVDTFPKTTGNGANNPTGIAAIIGPANTISDNKSTAPSSDLDTEGADTSGGMIITGSSRNIRVFANVFGLATFPAGSTPLGQLNYGNSGNGLVVTSPNNEVRNNLFLANARHGIVLRGTSANNNTIRGNYIGVSVPTGLGVLVGLGNTGDGIHITGASSNFIGGPAPSDANFIVANGRNGIALRGGGDAWANLLTRNRIYGNARGGTGIAIDLEHPVNAPDLLDVLDNPGINYANYDQHRPSICGGAADPPACSVANAKAPSFDGAGGGTALQWTVRNRANSSIRLEFFANAADGSDQVYLGEKVVSTDANGLPTGAGCSNGVCAASVGGSTATNGMGVVATSTDLFPSDVPPTGNQPNPLPLSPANNTSEFSDPALATLKLQITTAPPLPGGTTNQPYTVTFAATGGSGQYPNWAIAGGAVPTGLPLAAGTGVLSGTPSAAGSFTFSIQVTDSVGAKAIAAYTIVIAAQPPLVITTASPLPNGTVGSPYSLTFTASGGSGAPGNWQLQSGSLPDGLSLAAATGLLDGTPTQVGTFEFNVQVTDGQPTTAVRAYTLTIVPAPVALAITTASPLPNAIEASNYNQNLAATGGSGIYVNWQVTTGALPAGITLGAANGTLSGTPASAGSYNFTVRVTDNANAIATKAFALTVAPPPALPPAGPLFMASPDDIDFGEVNVGRTAIANVRLTNLDANNSVTPRFTDPPLTSGFTVDPGTCTTLAPGTSCTMLVAFTPTQGGDTAFASGSSICRNVLQNRCTIIIIIGGPSNTLARLTYRGIGTGTLAEVSPSRIDFGPQLVGTTTGVVVDIRNPTDTQLIFNPQLMLSNPAQFSVQNTSCGIGQIAAGGACTLTFRFAPVVVGVAESSARLTIGNGTISESYDIYVRGTGVNTAQPTYTTPMTLDFGMVNVGNTETIPVVTRNASGIPLTIAAATFGTADGVVWGRSVPFGGCTNPIANNATCTYNYRFTPRAQGAYSIDTQLAVTGSGVDQLVPLALSGTGVGTLIEASPVVLDFGTVNVGNIGRGRVTITNTSIDTLTRTFSGVFPFVFSTTCAATLAPAATCAINYSLSPDGDPLGLVESQATLLFENTATGNSQVVTIDLRANVVDALFRNGFE